MNTSTQPGQHEAQSKDYVPRHTHHDDLEVRELPAAISYAAQPYDARVQMTGADVARRLSNPQDPTAEGDARLFLRLMRDTGLHADRLGLTMLRSLETGLHPRQVAHVATRELLRQPKSGSGTGGRHRHPIRGLSDTTGQLPKQHNTTL